MSARTSRTRARVAPTHQSREDEVVYALEDAVNRLIRARDKRMFGEYRAAGASLFIARADARGLWRSYVHDSDREHLYYRLTRVDDGIAWMLVES